MATDPAALWRVPLGDVDQATLEAAFADDRRAWQAIGTAFSGLVELRLQGAFVTAFAQALRNGGPDAADAAILSAAAATLGAAP